MSFTAVCSKADIRYLSLNVRSFDFSEVGGKTPAGMTLVVPAGAVASMCSGSLCCTEASIVPSMARRGCLSACVRVLCLLGLHVARHCTAAPVVPLARCSSARFAAFCPLFLISIASLFSCVRCDRLLIFCLSPCASCNRSPRATAPSPASPASLPARTQRPSCLGKSTNQSTKTQVSPTKARFSNPSQVTYTSLDGHATSYSLF